MSEDNTYNMDRFAAARYLGMLLHSWYGFYASQVIVCEPMT